MDQKPKEKILKKKKTWTDDRQKKKDVKNILKNMKRCSNSFRIREMQNKHWATISHLSDWRKLKSIIACSVSETVGN